MNTTHFEVDLKLLKEFDVMNGYGKEIETDGDFKRAKNNNLT